MTNAYIFRGFLLWSAFLKSESKEEAQKRSECSRKYKSVTYISEERMLERTTPVLMSFPGSGNTWTRLLVEYATGHLSGSVDVNDNELKNHLQGERACGLRTSIVKGHPSDLVLNQFDEIKFVFKGQRKKCAKGMIREFKRVVFIAREPYSAIFSDFQRQVSGSHIGRITPEYLLDNRSVWEEAAVKAAEHYHEKWSSLVEPIFKRFSPSNYTTVRYEDLLDPSKSLASLEQLISFLQFPVTQDRLHCAFLLAEKPSISHRRSVVNATFAYSLLPMRSLCSMRDKMLPFMNYFGYSMRKGIKCVTFRESRQLSSTLQEAMTSIESSARSFESKVTWPNQHVAAVC
jgi:hypothetical protein